MMGNGKTSKDTDSSTAVTTATNRPSPRGTASAASPLHKAGNLAIQRNLTGQDADRGYLPALDQWQAREQSSLLANTPFTQGKFAAKQGSYATPGGQVNHFTSHALAGDAQGAIRSQTDFVIERRTPGAYTTPPSSTWFMEGIVSTPPTSGQSYPVEVTYRRLAAYLDASGRQFEVKVTGKLWFTTSGWEGISLGTSAPAFAELLDKRAARGRYTLTVAIKDRLSEERTSLLGDGTTLRDQYQQAGKDFTAALKRGGIHYAAPDLAFLAPQASVGEQYRAVKTYLDEMLRLREEALRAELNPKLSADIGKIKDILLDEWIDEDQESELLRILKRWPAYKDVLHHSGRSYFDQLLHELKNSSWHRNYGLWNGASTSFYTSLFDEVDQRRGELISLVSNNSILYGNYIPAWRPRKKGEKLNQDLIKRAADQILDALSGYTSEDDQKVIVDTLAGLGPAQKAVLEEIMSRHDERNWTKILGKYGEPTKESMLYWLFEDLNEDARDKLGKALITNGTFNNQAVQALKAGRGWGGKYLPWTTHYGREATKFWADMAVNEDSTLAAVAGSFSALWMPETAGTTVTVLAGARLAPGIAKIHPYIETGMLVTGTGISAYGVGLHGQAVLTGKDPITGEKLSDEEMLANKLMLMSSALFLGAGFAQAPATQRRLFEHRAPKFGELPPEFTASKLEVRPFSRPGQKLSEPFAGEGRQLLRHESGEIFEIRGQANAKEFTFTRLATGQRVFVSREGIVRRPGIPIGKTATPSSATGAAGTSGGTNTGALAPTGPGGLAAAGGGGSGGGASRTPPAETLLPRELRPDWSASQLSKAERKSLGRERWQALQGKLKAQSRAEILKKLRDSGVAEELSLDNEAIINRVFDHMVDTLQADRPTFKPSGEMETVGRRPIPKELVGTLLRGGGPLEGFVLDSILQENINAISKLLGHIESFDPDAVLAVQRGGVFLLDVLEYGKPGLAAISHRVAKGGGGKRTSFLKQKITDLLAEGKRKFVVVDIYMGGGAAGEFRNMYLELAELPAARDATFESLWLRETWGFERNTQQGLGLKPPPEEMPNVRDITETVTLALGDDMKMIFNAKSTKPIVIFDKHGNVVTEIQVPVNDPVTGETLTTPRQVLIRLMNGVKFWD